MSHQLHIGTLPSLVPVRQWARHEQDALKASAYREAALQDFSFAAHHHHTPLAREGDVAGVELHVEPLAQPFQALLPAARVLGSARRVGVDEGYLLPAPQEALVHSIAHMQLADGHYWCARPVLRPLCDLVWLRRGSAAAIDWQELLESFDRAGYGGACRAYLTLAQHLFGQPLPAGVRPGLGGRIAWWRVRHQTRHPWLMAAGEAYGFHRAMLAQLHAGPKSRGRLMTRLLHPKGYQRYLRALRARIGRAH